MWLQGERPELTLTEMTSTAIADAIRSREISATEAVQAHLQRIELVNPSINAVVTLCADRAMDRAAAADAALGRGDSWGPLHGVPITVKDTFDTAGVRTTKGFKPFADIVPDEDSTPVARLIDAGAVLLGKTNMPAFGENFQTDNDLFGRTNNPWDLDRTPGGSSGGSTAAIAARMIPLELGLDFAGSTRVPAHFCGVYGIKPTEFLVPTGAPPPRGIRHMMQAGPIARCVEDIELGLRTIAGPAPSDYEVPPVELGDLPRRSLESYSIAWMPGLADAQPSRAIRDTMVKTAEALDSLGCRVTEVTPEGWLLESIMDTWARLGWGELGSVLGEKEREDVCATKGASDHAEDPLLRGLYAALNSRLSDLGPVLDQRDALSLALDRVLDDADVFLMPTSMTTAFAHWPTGEAIPVDGRTESYWTVGLGHTVPCNLTGHPAVTCPVVLSEDGLPIGIQVITRRWRDMEALAFARHLAAVMRFDHKPDLDVSASG